MIAEEVERENSAKLTDEWPLDSQRGIALQKNLD